MYKFAQLWA